MYDTLHTRRKITVPTWLFTNIFQDIQFLVLFSIYNLNLAKDKTSMGKQLPKNNHSGIYKQKKVKIIGFFFHIILSHIQYFVCFFCQLFNRNYATRGCHQMKVMYMNINIVSLTALRLAFFMGYE